MATKSFLKDVQLRDKKQCQAFIKALEKSQSYSPKTTTTTFVAKDMQKDQIRKVFGGTE